MKKFAVALAVVMLLVGAAAAVAAPKDVSVVFIPKLTGNMFFESAAEGEMDVIDTFVAWPV